MGKEEEKLLTVHVLDAKQEMQKTLSSDENSPLDLSDLTFSPTGQVITATPNTDNKADAEGE
jgi:WD40 repeat protein